MKTLLGPALIALIILMATESPAGIFDSVMTSDWDEVQTEKYMLDVYGFDVRAYEWTPVTDITKRCVMVFAKSGPVGMQCWTVETGN